MIKKILFCALLALSSSIHAYKEEPLISLCDETGIIFDRLKDNFREIPLIAGTITKKSLSEKNGTMSLWINPSTKNWTIVFTFSEKSCIVELGNNLLILAIEKQEKSKLLDTLN